MNRTIEYVIPRLPAFQTVKGFLKSKGYSVQNLKILKQAEGIFLNGIPVHLNAPLSDGETLTVRIRENDSSENIFPVALPIDIVFEDEDLLIVNKPAGMPIHPSQNNRDNTLANGLAYYYQQQGKPFVFRCINRLDRDTSGLTIVAKHFVSAGILGSHLAEKTAQASSDDPSPASPLLREYLAIASGHITPACGTITAPLGRKAGSIIERCVDFENGETAITHYRVLEEKKECSLVSLVLETGRTHQIRIHMKYIGHPLVGDSLYNPQYAFSENSLMKINRQALHSHRLSFHHPITGEHLEFTAPMPDDMSSLLT